MPRFAKASATAAVLLASQLGCAAHATPARCTLTGAELIAPDASAEELCQAFQQRLAKALSNSSNLVQIEDLTVALAAAKHGSIEAKVSLRSEQGVETLPVVAIDVSDRSLAKRDLDGLADAVAHVMSSR